MLLSLLAVGCWVASAFAIPTRSSASAFAIPIRSSASAFATSTPSSGYVVHEQRAVIPFGWRRVERLNGSFILPIRIALVQTNLDKAEEYLLSVSDPSSENYGKHWSAERIANTFKPSDETVNAVLTWLVSAGIGLQRIKKSQSLGWLQFNCTVNEAQKLLKTEYFKYKHTSGTPHVGCTAYHIPESVRKHIDFITPTLHFDIKTTKPKQDNAKVSSYKNQTSAIGTPVNPGVGKKIGSTNSLSLPKQGGQADNTTNSIDGLENSDIETAQPNEDYAKVSASKNDTSAIGAPVKPDAAKSIGSPDSPSLPKQGTQIDNSTNSIDGLKTCDTVITPDCLRALYGIPVPTTANPANSFGIVEYTPQIYIQEDLDLFFSNYSKNQKQRSPILNSINGGIAGNRTQGFFLNAESDLDLEYGMTLVNPQPVQLYQVGDFIEGGSLNDFLDAVDASYCTFDGGDDPVQDGRYPSSRGGYEGPKNCGGFAATKVISSSYAYNEADLTARYETRQCAEYAKLGLAGSTFLYASGDYGVSGNLFKCIEPRNKTLNVGNNGIFNPSFPASCPFVTAVGATQLKANRTVQLNSTFTSPEVAAETRIESGGGFSNVFGLPAYQATAVKNWFATANPPYGADRFNNSQQTRGYPDIAANGVGYITAIDAKFGLVYGTSASTPTVASVFVLINQARLDAGKSPIGFVNPVLYANPQALNDVISGSNPGCGTQGFSAQAGWDPITGLGTPNFPKLLATFLALP